ncbi:hypothetical protein KSP40_PGU002603 [Platanthera guangdongensis]|uniref:Uncharacterized protein n=1 Tax=Platanthera guangdongensis TaxID=2320717 RepID=A0ABR2M973_9ASPA
MLSLLLETSLAPLFKSVADLSSRLSSIFPPQAIPSFGCLDPALSESRQGEMPHEDGFPAAATNVTSAQAPVSPPQVAVFSVDLRFRLYHRGAMGPPWAAGMDLETLAGVVFIAGSEVDKSMICSILNDSDWDHSLRHGTYMLTLIGTHLSVHAQEEL